MSTQLIDWRDVPVEVGSLIVYPGRHSNHMWMVEAEVLEVMQEENLFGDLITVLRVQPLRSGSHRISKKPVKLTALERVTVIRGLLRREVKV